MPTVFKGKDCEHSLEVKEEFKEPTSIKCPECGRSLVYIPGTASEE